MWYTCNINRTLHSVFSSTMVISTWSNFHYTLSIALPTLQRTTRWRYRFNLLKFETLKFSDSAVSAWLELLRRFCWWQNRLQEGKRHDGRSDRQGIPIRICVDLLFIHFREQVTMWIRISLLKHFKWLIISYLRKRTSKSTTQSPFESIEMFVASNDTRVIDRIVILRPIVF